MSIGDCHWTQLTPQELKASVEHLKQVIVENQGKLDADLYYSYIYAILEATAYLNDNKDQIYVFEKLRRARNMGIKHEITSITNTLLSTFGAVEQIPMLKGA